MDAATIRRALDAVVARAVAQGITGTIEVFGGSALVVLYPDEPALRSTEDVDARIRTSRSLADVIADVGRDFGFPPEWLNSRSEPFLPPGAVASQDGALTVTFATPTQLIAAKMAAGRPQDLHDLAILAGHERLTRPEQLVEIVFDAYGEESVVLRDTRDEALQFAREVFARARRMGMRVP